MVVEQHSVHERDCPKATYKVVKHANFIGVYCQGDGDPFGYVSEGRSCGYYALFQGEGQHDEAMAHLSQLIQ